MMEREALQLKGDLEVAILSVASVYVPFIL
jgi:hypothetical protein